MTNDNQTIILIALPDHYVHGGVTERVLVLAPYLKKLGYPTITLYPRTGKSLTSKEEVLLVERRFYWGRYRLRRGHPVHNILWFAGLPFSIWSCWHAIIKSRAGIMHTNGLLNIVPALAARLAGLPVVWHLIGDHYPRWLVRLMMPLVRLLASKMVFVGKSMSLFYKEEPSRRNCVISEPVAWTPNKQNITSLRKDLMHAAETPFPDKSWHDTKEQGKWIGAIGNLVPAKGWNYFLDAAELLLKVQPDLYFVIIGSPSPTQEAYAETLRKRIETTHLNGRVWMTGFVKDAGRFAAVFNVFVLASIQEGTPISILEAMLAEVPVIATDVGSVAEMLEEKRGLLCPARDPAALVQATESVLSEQEAVVNVQDARKWVEHRHPQKIALLFQDLYQSVM